MNTDSNAVSTHLHVIQHGLFIVIPSNMNESNQNNKNDIQGHCSRKQAVDISAVDVLEIMCFFSLFKLYLYKTRTTPLNRCVCFSPSLSLSVSLITRTLTVIVSWTRE